MGTIISFVEADSAQDWVAARWIGNRFLEDVSASWDPSDSAVHEVLQNAIAFDGFGVYRLPPEVAARTLVAMEAVAAEVLNGSTARHRSWQENLDETQRETYRKKMMELMASIAKYSRLSARDH